MSATEARVGRLEAIWIKRAHGRPTEPVSAATLVEGRGLDGNVWQGATRQVTVIEREVFDGLRATLGPELDPAMRRANLMVSGVRLQNTRRHMLWIGSCRIDLVSETRPCELMDEALQGLRKALEPDWGGGAYGRVAIGGEIRVGDEVRLEAASEDARVSA